jgi:hemolysin D
MIHHSSAITRLQLTPPAPFGRSVLWLLLSLFFLLLLWAAFGQLDIVAVAEGKLVPQTYIKIVQPAEQGVVNEILVKEGEAVKQGQVLLRMDAVSSEADVKTFQNEFQRHSLALRRIDAELAGKPLEKQTADPADLYAQLLAQYNANRFAYQSALDEQRSVLEKARQDKAAAEEIKSKLAQVLPHYRNQEEAYNQLNLKGFAVKLMATDKQRERIEKEQDLKSQEFIIRSAEATIEQVQKKITQIGADYHRQLMAERIEVSGQLDKVNQELAKQQHRQELLELKASQAGIVKDLATHTIGTVTAPGTILLTLVPMEEPLKAEVWVSNEDIGFVRPEQPVKLKFSPFPFQKYGMVDGAIEQVSADARETPGQENSMDIASRDSSNLGLAYKALVVLNQQKLDVDGHAYKLAPGMHVSAEIRLGTRSLLEYLLSPVQGAFHDAGRER